MKKAAWIVSFLTLIATSVIIQFMPDKLPTHYDINGYVDAYGSKYSYLIVPVIIISVTALLNYIGYRFTKKAATVSDDKEKAEAVSNSKVVGIVSLCTTAVLSASLFVALYNAYVSANSEIDHLEIDELKITTILCGILFIVAGNFLPKTKLNGDIGLRVSWSMYNDNTWRKTNHFAAVSLMIAGVLSIVTTAWVNGIVSVFMMLFYLSITIAIILAYAHKVYIEEVNK